MKIVDKEIDSISSAGTCVFALRTTCRRWRTVTHVRCIVFAFIECAISAMTHDDCVAPCDAWKIPIRVCVCLNTFSFFARRSFSGRFISIIGLFITNERTKKTTRWNGRNTKIDSDFACMSTRIVIFFFSSRWFSNDNDAIKMIDSKQIIMFIDWYKSMSEAKKYIYIRNWMSALWWKCDGCAWVKCWATRWKR